MEAQRDVGVLGGIFGRTVEGDEVKADPRLSRARQLLERDRGMSEVARRQFVHAVVPPPGVERVAHQHRVVIRRDDPRAVAAEDDHVILEVLPDLENARVGKHGVEPGDDGRDIELVDGLGQQPLPDLVRERNVARDAGFEREAQPDQLGLDRIEVGRLRIDRDDAAPRRLAQPPVEPVERRHALIGLMVECDRRGVLDRDRSVRRLDVAPEFGQQRTEAVLGEERRQRGLRWFAQRQVGERHSQRQVVLQPDEFTRQPRHIRAGGEVFAQLGLFHLVEARQHRFDRAELLDQLRCALWPDAAHAGDGIDRVAHEREDFAELLGRNAEFFDDLRAVDPDILHRVVQVEPRTDELHQVLVRTDDRHVHAREDRRLGIGCDDVVGLDPLLLDARHRKGADGVANQRELRNEVLGRRRAVRLVPGIHLVAERMAAGVEDHREMCRGVGTVELLDQLPQHRRHAIDGVDHRSARIVERGQPVVGTENIAGAVDEIEVLFRHTPV